MSTPATLLNTPLSLAELQSSWDRAADDIEVDPMRPVRYGKCLGLLRQLDRSCSLLEVGCGEGSGLRYAATLGFANLTGCEISAERLRRAATRTPPGTRLSLVSGSGELPFADSEFDAVYSTAVIEHTLAPEAFLREIRRVVKPGGRVVISSDCWQWRLLQALGFYQSVQPIDRAVTTGLMLERMKRCGFDVLGYDGFPLPGSEYRFLRMLGSGIRQSYPGRALLHRVLRRTFGRSGSAQHSPPAVQPSAGDGMVGFLSVANASQLDAPNWSSWVRSMFSDENVFLLAPSVAAVSPPRITAGR